MNIFNKALNSLSIGVKISIGYAFIVLVFSFQVVLNFESMNKIAQDFKDLTAITENAISILNIDKDISDLQKSALTYSQTGSQSVFEKMQLTFKDIEEKLLKVRENTTLSESKAQINKMNAITKYYGINLHSLQEKFHYRNQLVINELPKIMDQITLFLQNIIQEYRSSDDLKILQNMLIYWLKTRISAMLFLENRKHTDKQNVNRLLKIIKDEHNKFFNRKNSKKIIIQEENLLNLLDSFIDIFDQSIQANRIYLSLVNVVMAGEVLEFAELAKILRTKKLTHLKKIASDNNHSVSEIKYLLVLSILLAIPILFSVAVFFHFNISKSIRAIASTFSNLREGEEEMLIPEIERNDEIGKLAKAANDYKQVSLHLKKAKIEAEESAKAKADFLANMSHEIRTPMNGILGMVSILYETETNAEQRKMLDTISSCGEDLMTILNDILDISKIESGKIVLENIPFSLQKMIFDITFLFEGEARKKGIEFKVSKLSPDLPDYITGDITRLKQILINLISNAIKFTEKGSVEFIIKSTPCDLKKHKISFEVKDSGIGIDETAQEKLFSAFSQADSSITRRYGGTGLGLTISAKLAQLLHSKITVSSTIGKGSVFGLEVEFLEIDKPLDNHISLEPGTKGKILRVLLVEDNPINIELASMMIGKLGHQIEIAKNGFEAVKKVESMEFDIIFMDMQMPIMDGVQATVEIKKLHDKSHIPIIAMTANVMKEDRERCYQVGMIDFLSKPIRKKNLLEIFEKISKEYYSDQIKVQSLG